MQYAVPVDKYSQDFESTVAEYATGKPADRGPKTTFELYTRMGHMLSFYDACEKFFPMKGKRFIDVGCGTGVWSVGASLKGAQVSGCDFVQKAVDITSKRWREHQLDGDLFQYDLREAPAQKLLGAFDFVTCYQILEHIPRSGQFHALANLFKMVAPGGYLFIDTENSLYPFDRHDTRTWLVRYLTKSVHVDILQKLGKSINIKEPSSEETVYAHDYMSYDEIFGAAVLAGFEVICPFMPWHDKRTALRVLSGSDWLHDSVLKDIDLERFYPICLLLQKKNPALI